ncbi:MAG: transglycosylase domain-containing protein [Treponema sp.]|nr:transglycosylase domain-containing protein [Treponema sp.]
MIKNKSLQFIMKVALFVFIIFLLIWLFLRFSPYPELRAFQTRPYSVRYYDRYGMLLQITPLENGLRREIPNEIPQSVKDVFVFSEDKRFYLHPGIDIISVARAFFQNISSGRRVSGASTITMQLARLISDNARKVYQHPRNQNMGHKIIEAFNALRLETRFSKNKILEMYINSLPFGFSAEGIASAARTFFSEELSMLSPSQLFCLAVIPRRPSLYNPLNNPEICVAAASDLHSKFAANKKYARKYPLLVQADERDFEYALSSARRFRYPFELPHLIRLINAQNMSPDNLAKKRTLNETRLSVDLALQRFIEKAVAGNVAAYYSSRLTNGSAVVIENETAEILAWVGSADFFNSHASGQIDGVLALNQPGSSMKPFLYAMALENGFNPSDVIADIPMTFGDTEIYIPQNFNNRFNGPMLMRSALASSLNIPAVYLLYRLGVYNYTQKLLSLGFDSVKNTAEDAGLGLALGNAPVSLLELVRAFSVFPRDGIFLPVTWQLNESREIEPSVRRNRTFGSENSNLRFGEQRIYSSDTARLICSFLSDSSARVLAFGAGRNFRTSYPAIFKTGTANQYQNIVALGASMKYTIGVWMGNFTGETVLDKTGSSVPAAIARNTLNALHEYNRDVSDFPLPEELYIKRVCAVSGMEPVNGCISVINEYIFPNEDRKECTWHQIINGRSETVYPAEYQAWFTSTLRHGSIDYGSRPLEIVNPRDGFEYFAGLNFGMYEIPAEVIGGSGDLLHVTHNEDTFSVERPFMFFLPRKKGQNILHVKCGNEDVVITFNVEY